MEMWVNKYNGGCYIEGFGFLNQPTGLELMQYSIDQLTEMAEGKEVHLGKLLGFRAMLPITPDQLPAVMDDLDDDE